MVAILSTCLASCSYGYDVIAEMRGGKIVLLIDPESHGKPPSNCVRRIKVTEAEQGAASRPNWVDDVDYSDECENHFPVAYGQVLIGKHIPDRELVPPKPLRTDVVYEVITTSGATGYGYGRFVIHSDGTVENLKQPKST